MSLLTAPVEAFSEPATDDVAPRSAPPAEQPPCRRRLLLAAVAIAGVLAGAVGSALLVTLTFLSAAEDIGRGMSGGLGPVRESLAEPQAPGQAADVSLPGGTAPGGPVERFAPVAPAGLGSDRVLNGFAESCFDGDLRACDDLWSESPPMSDYETYAATCAGRVKRDAVPNCADLA